MESPQVLHPQQRLESIDMLRGLAMVFMALDHSRDFFSHGHYFFDPVDLLHTTAGFFITRWITNFCAPVFIFLSGVGLFFSFAHGKTLGQMQKSLVTRGLWLIFLEFTFVRCGWYFNFDYHYVKLGVIWCIGWCFITLAGLMVLPRWLVGLLGLVMIAGHNLLDLLTPETFGAFGWLWRILHVPGTLQPVSGYEVVVKYPLIPWIGVMAAGYAFGPVFRWEASLRRKLFLGLGMGLVLVFIILRGLNLYGDPNPWTTQSTRLFTFFSFLNCQKYPPSLLYLLIALGPAFLALAWCEKLPALLTRPLVLLGQVPFFFYILHLPLLHAIAVGTELVRYGEADWLFANPPWQVWPIDYSQDLVSTYLAWMMGALILYPACRWYAGLKSRHRDWWWLYYL